MLCPRVPMLCPRVLAVLRALVEFAEHIDQLLVDPLVDAMVL